MAIKVEKIQLPTGNFTVHFFSDPDIHTNKKVDLSRAYNGTLCDIDNLESHNHCASQGHTSATVDAYIKRVLTDITEALKEEELTCDADIEKVKAMIIPIPVNIPGSNINEN